MENKSYFNSKSIKSDFSVLSIAENNDVLRENLKKNSDDEYEKNKFLESIASNDSSIKFETPSELLVNKIIQQVEFLFSDANVWKDKFLLKHMRRNKEGYVSLKLISSLRKVKALSRDWRVVAYSLQQSEKLQMNREMTKIKRVDPLPLPDELDASRTVLVLSYLPASWTFESLKKLLKRLGTIESLVIVKSKADVVNENIKKTLTLHEKFATFPFAVVTFQTAEESAKAVHQTSHPASLLRVVPLIKDENEVSKTVCTSLYPRERNRCFIETKESSVNFEDKREIQSSSKAKNKSSFPYVCNGYEPDNSRWNQRKNRIVKDTVEKQKPFMMILRLPKGPDDTRGFRRCKASPTFKN